MPKAVKLTKPKQLKPKCQECNKTLKKIGAKRVNGKDSFLDWSNRKYHKKCLKEIKQKADFANMLARYKDDL